MEVLGTLPRAKHGKTFVVMITDFLFNLTKVILTLKKVPTHIVIFSLIIGLYQIGYPIFS